MINLLAIFPEAARVQVRPTQIHAHPCKHCPSAHHEPDPESLDYLAAPRAEQIDSVFVCAWRPDKQCKGYCDFLGVNEAELVATFGGGA
jgi:hypothetical protein